MEKRIPGKELDAQLEAIYQRNPNGLLTIDSDFDNYLNQYHFQYLLPEVLSGKVSSEMVITDTIKATHKVIHLAKKDALNVRKCTKFLRKKFPHAIFSCGNFAISVNNLFPDEIKVCLAQKGMKFTYYND